MGMCSRVCGPVQVPALKSCCLAWKQCWHRVSVTAHSLGSSHGRHSSMFHNHSLCLKAHVNLISIWSSCLSFLSSLLSFFSSSHFCHPSCHKASEILGKCQALCCKFKCLPVHGLTSQPTGSFSSSMISTIKGLWEPKEGPNPRRGEKGQVAS